MSYEPLNKHGTVAMMLARNPNDPAAIALDKAEREAMKPICEDATRRWVSANPFIRWVASQSHKKRRP